MNVFNVNILTAMSSVEQSYPDCVGAFYAQTYFT